MIDRRGSTWSFQYTDNNLLQRFDVTNGSESYFAEYTYDEVGNRKTVTDSGNAISYNLDSNGIYQADPLNRINSIRRTFDNATYTTSYQYNQGGQLTKVYYPSLIWQIFYRINFLVINSVYKVQVRPRCVSSLAHICNNITL